MLLTFSIISHFDQRGVYATCTTFVFSFPLGITAVLRKIENNAYAKVFGANKVHYRKCASSLSATVILDSESGAYSKEKRGRG